MTCLFFTWESQNTAAPNPALDGDFTHCVWRPGATSIVPGGVPWMPYTVWWGMHHLRIFQNRDYQVFLVRCGDRVVHRTCVFPRFFRFPFMQSDDLQIGDCWTAPDFRGQGIAPFAIRAILQSLQRPGRRFWYITDASNAQSIRAAEKAGLVRAGQGRRCNRLGMRAIGYFILDPS
jgi:RimJ/RimL family protein N-acetyltransferase